MDPELAKELTGLLHDSKQFVLEQAPDVIQQCILWAKLSFTFGFVFFLLFSIALVIACYKFGVYAWKLSNEHPYAHADLTLVVAACAIASGAVSIATTIISCVNFYYMCMVWFAPKVYLLWYASSFIK